MTTVLEEIGVPKTGPSGAQRRQRGAMTHPLMLLPAILLLGLVFAYPLLDMIWRSFTTPGASGATLDNYQHIFSEASYWKIFQITFEIAVVVTLLCAVLGYPLAYLLSSAPPRVVAPLMVLLLAPLLTSVLVRTFGFLVILAPQGALNQLLAGLNLGPVTLIYNRFGVLLAMTLTLLPYIVFTLYGNMRAIDRSLLDAAQGMGASRFTAWRTVFLPLSLPGLAGGSLLVFVLALGYFITPRLMGGQRDLMIGMVIEQGVAQGNNFGLAAALATLLLAVTTLCCLGFTRFVGISRILSSHGER